MAKFSALRDPQCWFSSHVFRNFNPT